MLFSITFQKNISNKLLLQTKDEMIYLQVVHSLSFIKRQLNYKFAILSIPLNSLLKVILIDSVTRSIQTCTNCMENLTFLTSYEQSIKSEHNYGCNLTLLFFYFVTFFLVQSTLSSLILLILVLPSNVFVFRPPR
jgi:hypothetical protein